MLMPWGKYEGEDIEDLPDGYLKWLAQNCEDEDIREAADEEFLFRKYNGTLGANK